MFSSSSEIRLVPTEEAQNQLLESNSNFYLKISRGLIPPPVKIGSRKSAWPQHELDAIKGARISGKSDDEIRSIVKSLVSARQYDF
jgi:prophage regulatory protein